MRFSAEDSIKQGFETVVIEEACRAIDMGGSLKLGLEAMRGAGVEVKS